MATDQSTTVSSSVEYRNIPGVPGYRVGSDGSVWTQWVRGGVGGRGVHHLGGQGDWKMMKTSIGPKGVPGLHLRRGGKSVSRTVGRLILEAFVGPCPAGLECCHFPDSNPLNNRLENLRWDTRTANAQDKVSHGTAPIGERNPKAKLTAADIPEIIRAAAQGESQSSIGRRKGVKQRTISDVILGKKWKHVPRPTV